MSGLRYGNGRLQFDVPMQPIRPWSKTEGGPDALHFLIYFSRLGLRHSKAVKGPSDQAFASELPMAKSQSEGFYLLERDAETTLDKLFGSAADTALTVRTVLNAPDSPISNSKIILAKPLVKSRSSQASTKGAVLIASALSNYFAICGVMVISQTIECNLVVTTKCHGMTAIGYCDGGKVRLAHYWMGQDVR